MEKDRFEELSEEFDRVVEHADTATDGKSAIEEGLSNHPGRDPNASRYHRGHYRGMLRALKLFEDVGDGEP